MNYNSPALYCWWYILTIKSFLVTTKSQLVFNKGFNKAETNITLLAHIIISHFGRHKNERVSSVLWRDELCIMKGWKKSRSRCLFSNLKKRERARERRLNQRFFSFFQFTDFNDLIAYLLIYLIIFITLQKNWNWQMFSWKPWWFSIVFKYVQCMVENMSCGR